MVFYRIRISNKRKKSRLRRKFALCLHYAKTRLDYKCWREFGSFSLHVIFCYIITLSYQHIRIVNWNNINRNCSETWRECICLLTIDLLWTTTFCNLTIHYRKRYRGNFVSWFNIDCHHVRFIATFQNDTHAIIISLLFFFIFLTHF